MNSLLFEFNLCNVCLNIWCMVFFFVFIGGLVKIKLKFLFFIVDKVLFFFMIVLLILFIFLFFLIKVSVLWLIFSIVIEWCGDILVIIKLIGL